MTNKCFKVCRRKPKAIADLFLNFGRVILRHQKISFQIRKNIFDRKDVKRNLKKRLKVPKKLLILENMERCFIIKVSNNGKRIYPIKEKPKEFSKLCSKKYFLRREYPKLFRKVFFKKSKIVDLKFVKKERKNVNLANNNKAEVTPTRKKENLQSVEIILNLPAIRPKTNLLWSKFQCKICDLYIGTKQDLKKHLYLTHTTNIRLFQCNICRKKFKTSLRLKSHIEKVHAIKKANLQCDYCGERCKAKKQLLRHFYKHTDQFKCSTCEFRGTSKYHLENHLKSHRSKDLKCKICGITFSTTNQLEIHLYKHPVCNFKCPHSNCDRSCADEQLLKLHQIVHQPKSSYQFKCNFGKCDKTYKLKNSLNRHQLSAHSDLTQFKCSECIKTFKNRSSLARHVKTHHKDQRQETLEEILTKEKALREKTKQEVKSLAEKDPLWYKKLTVDKIIAKTPISKVRADSRVDCIICQSKKNNLSILRMHIQTVHFAEQRLFQCDYCQKFYKDKGAIRTHMKCHFARLKFT